MTTVARRSLVSFALAGVLALACKPPNSVVVPNRVLDRPTDVTLACVRKTGESIEVLALNQCENAGPGHCLDDDRLQLIGFVANSQTNEVAMFRRCDVNGVVDLDPDAPGYNLVPVGTLPSRIAQTPDCRVVTANFGSCDLSAIEMPALASYAVGLPLGIAPSGLVSTIVPRRSDGSPLGAAPGDMIAVPAGLSLASDEGTGEGGTEEGAGDTGGTAATGGDGGVAIGGACNPDASASVYVTFPTCQLIAEISLDTQRVLQSRQFVLGDDGVVTLVDSGPDPECPVECPAQFDGDVPDDRTTPDGEVFPVALALVEPDESDDAPPEEEAVTFPTLFVGGTQSDEVFEIEILRDSATSTSLGFAPPEQLRRLELEDPAGVIAIRPTPPMTMDDDEVHQFLYVISGDGSTHVVDRDLIGTSLGVECDTQVDPAQASSRACHPIDPGSQGGQAERRPFAAGPGIRGSDGSTITDWAFERAVDPKEENDRTRAPFGRAGVVGIGVTSFGRMVLAVFSQYDDAPPTVTTSNDNRTIDPLGLLNVAIRPHMLWPITDPSSGEPSVMPLVTDEPPNRVLPGEDQLTQMLAPALRQIDLTYFATEKQPGEKSEFSEAQQQLWEALGRPENTDRLGSFDGDALYESFPVRVAVRDYRQWRGDQLWQMIWEPAIPGTEGTTGRVVCEDPSDYGGGTCHVAVDPATGEHTKVRIVDEGATFCDEGVLPGDKLVLFGCGTDDECGPGRRCLRDPTAPGTNSGICVSAGAYAANLDELRKVCAPFIADPCGAPRREYVVTAAKQTELVLGEIDIPATTFMRTTCPVAAGRDNLLDPLGPKPTDPVDECVDRELPNEQGTCSAEYPVPCDDFCYPETSDCDDSRLGLVECEARLTCALAPGLEQPSGGCTADSECGGLGLEGETYLCIDNVCRTPCEGGSLNCRQALLPGPGCFAEFVHYAVATNETLVVSLDPAQRFITDRVITDPNTEECREDPTVSNLLTSRIRLGADEAATFANIPACPNADEASPSDPNPCRIMTLRDEPGGDSTLYHLFSYNGTPVEALRFSNPYGTLVLDLVSLLDLGGPTELLSSGAFPDCYARFRRARIPRNYREEFGTPSPTGYAAYNDPIIVGNTPLTYPVRVVPAPELGAAFTVDAGGRGGVAGVRGQVIRVTIQEGVIRGDEQFLVR